MNICLALSLTWELPEAEVRRFSASADYCQLKLKNETNMPLYGLRDYWLPARSALISLPQALFYGSSLTTGVVRLTAYGV